MTNTPYYDAFGVTVYAGDCFDDRFDPSRGVLTELPDASVHAVVTDPPYELEFMGRKWDASGITFNPEMWQECLRVLKPGGHLLAFGGSRTWHRLAAAVEDAGFELRDSVAWLYASGFPKSLDVSKAIDKAAGVDRAVVGLASRPDGTNRPNANKWTDGMGYMGNAATARVVTAPTTDDATRWEGWGTALKPGHEPCVVAQKPHSATDILGKIGSHLDRLEAECRRLASGAGRSSVPTPAGSPVASPGSAPESAAIRHEGEPDEPIPTGVAADSSATTGTSVSASAAETFLSTVMSWRTCWVELCEATNTSTTSTATSRTTDLQTLSSCLSKLTLLGTEKSTPVPGSWSSLASAADSLFAAGVLSWRATRALSAVESVTGGTLTSRQAAGGGSPAFEPIVVARKPLDGTVAANVLEYGAGALNIDGCRIAGPAWSFTHGPATSRSAGVMGNSSSAREGVAASHPAGRWPSNVVLTHAPLLDAETGEAVGDACADGCVPGCPVAELDEQGGVRSSGANPTRRGSDKFRDAYGEFRGQAECQPARGAESGVASRFFPVFRFEAKAPASERPRVDGVAHPTVKPLALMRWLVRLVTPPSGTVLDPFLGSGTTAQAARAEGFQCIGIERDETYLPLIRARLDGGDVDLFGGVA
jgi:hypothetical protein